MLNISRFLLIFMAFILVLGLNGVHFADASEDADNDAKKEIPDVIKFKGCPHEHTAVVYEEWNKTRKARGEFIINKVISSVDKDNDEEYRIIIDANLYSQITASIDQYVADVTAEGYNVGVYASSGGTPDDLRTFMQNLYALGMEGCLMVGDLPIAWYEDECDAPYAQFPMDIYYMDLTSTFEDTDINGIYDTYGPITEHAAEIWFGRLYASSLQLGGADEVSLMQNYFAKNHLYRTGQLKTNSRSLVMVDNEPGQSVVLEYIIHHYNLMVGAYCVTIFMYSEEETTGDNYKDQLMDGYQYVHRAGHGSAITQYFSVPNPSYDTHITSGEILSIDPATIFYRFGGCQVGCYTYPEYLAGWYVFADTYGLAAICQTRVGGIGTTVRIGEALQADSTFGQCALKMHEERIMYGDGLHCGFFGFTLLGDPTLKIAPREQLEITTPTLRSTSRNFVYYEWLEVQGGAKPYQWEIVSGSLPPNLVFNPTTVVISGFPVEYGDYHFTIAAKDSCLEDQYTDTVDYYIGVIETCGDVNNDDLVDILDIIYLIDYKFKDGPAPHILGEGDVNSSHVVDILDIIFLIDYKFKGDVAPYCTG